MKTRIVHTKFWVDGYVSTLNRVEKLSFMYLITNDQIGLNGIYELSDSKAVFEMGLTQSEWKQIKDKFSKDDKFRFYKGWVKIVNVDKYQQFLGEKNEKAKQNELNLINKDIIDTLSIPYPYPIERVGTIGDSPNNHKSIINNHKSISKEEKSNFYNREDINEKVLLEISDKYGCGNLNFLAFVKSKFDDICNWEDEKPGRMRGRNWKITLINWVKKDAIKIRKEASEHVSKRGIDARGVR